MIKSNRHARFQQQSDLQMVQTRTEKQKQNRYSTIGRNSVQYTVQMSTKPEFGVTFACDKVSRLEQQYKGLWPRIRHVRKKNHIN